MEISEKLYQQLKYLSDTYDKRTSFWPDIAEKYGVGQEEIRSAYRREREKRNDKTTYSKFDSSRFPVVVFDIETLPLKGYFFDVWKQDISPIQVESDWIILSWAAKDLMSGEIRSQILTPNEAISRDDKRIVFGLWEEFERASILIGQNILSFDIPKSNTRFLFHGLQPPAPYRVIDTYKILKTNFRFTYNRMAWVCKQLGLREKISNDGFPLWIDCGNGKQESLNEMQSYNCGDILAAQELYLTVRPWDKHHPNIGLFYDDVQDGVCKNCGSNQLTPLDKPDFTPLGEFVALRCKKCGAINRKAKNISSKEKRASLLR